MHREFTEILKFRNRFQPSLYKSDKEFNRNISENLETRESKSFNKKDNPDLREKFN